MSITLLTKSNKSHSINHELMKQIKSKKAQVKMGETIAILFIFFILLIIGAVIYFNIQKSTLQKDLAAQFEAHAVELAQITSFLPEVQCTEKNVVTPNCFDLFKLYALDTMSTKQENTAYYSREFEYSTISVRIIYPIQMTKTIFNNTPPKFVESSNFQIPIAIYNPAEEKSSFGVLDVRVYR